MLNFAICRKLQIAGMMVSMLFSSAVWSANGLFWKLESPSGVTSYLFGTIHTDDNRVTDFPQSVMDALSQSEMFMMEVAQGHQPQSMQMKRGSLKEYLNEEELIKVRALSEFHVMHYDNVLKMKPWLLAVIFDSPRPITPFAQDNLLMTKAEELSKDVKGIETESEHFGAMDLFSMEEQLIMLRAAIDKSQAQKEREYEKLMALYIKGDADRLLEMDKKLTAGHLPKPLWEKMRHQLLDERNDLMAKRTLPFAKEKPLFIAVGASHLGGKSGLISAYRKAGFKLTPIKK